MRRGLKRKYASAEQRRAAAPRARPPMRRGLKHKELTGKEEAPSAARAAPYEKGTETLRLRWRPAQRYLPRARPPMRRGLKPPEAPLVRRTLARAARPGPHQKGTGTERKSTTPNT